MPSKEALGDALREAAMMDSEMEASPMWIVVALIAVDVRMLLNATNPMIAPPGNAKMTAVFPARMAFRTA